MEDRPIVYTLMFSPTNNFCSIRTTDFRADDLCFNTVKVKDMPTKMTEICEILNNKGYAVLFEVG